MYSFGFGFWFFGWASASVALHQHTIILALFWYVCNSRHRPSNISVRSNACNHCNEVIFNDFFVCLTKKTHIISFRWYFVTKLLCRREHWICSLLRSKKRETIIWSGRERECCCFVNDLIVRTAAITFPLIHHWFVHELNLNRKLRRHFGYSLITRQWQWQQYRQ